MTTDIEDLAENLDVDVDFEDVEPDLEHGSDAVDMEKKEATVIKPFRAGADVVRNEHHNFVLEDQSQFSVTVKYRPECPSCSHVLAEEDEPNQLSGECSVCGVETCHRCQNRCSGCGTILCPDCTQGHGLKDETYCSTCRSDVDEDIGFERGMEKREQEHKEELDKREQELQEEKERTKMELQELKTQKEQIRQDYQTVVDIVRKIKEMRSGESGSTDHGSSDSGKPFGGTTVFLTGSAT